MTQGEASERFSTIIRGLPPGRGYLKVIISKDGSYHVILQDWEETNIPPPYVEVKESVVGTSKS